MIYEGKRGSKCEEGKQERGIRRENRVGGGGVGVGGGLPGKRGCISGNEAAR